MAKPRIFVSSTYFDLRVVRADLQRFLRELGYEPVLFERGHIPYGREEALEEYCYREIGSCDILVAIIGGNYGTQSKDRQNSITQKELKTAYEAGKQVYIFVERAVLSEFRTYQKNKDVEGFKPASVSDSRVFSFLEEVYGLPGGNPIEPFETSEEIIRFLREQMAGLFQRLLQEASRQREMQTIEGIKSTAQTLKQLVTFLTEERSKGDQAIKDILLSTHPAFTTLKDEAKIPYRVIFYNFTELRSLLEARGFELYEDPFSPETEPYSFRHGKAGFGVNVMRKIFDDAGKLKVYTPEEWHEAFISRFSFTPAVEVEEDPPF